MDSVIQLSYLKQICFELSSISTFIVQTLGCLSLQPNVILVIISDWKFSTKSHYFPSTLLLVANTTADSEWTLGSRFRRMSLSRGPELVMNVVDNERDKNSRQQSSAVYMASANDLTCTTMPLARYDSVIEHSVLKRAILSRIYGRYSRHQSSPVSMAGTPDNKPLSYLSPVPAIWLTLQSR